MFMRIELSTIVDNFKRKRSKKKRVLLRRLFFIFHLNSINLFQDLTFSADWNLNFVHQREIMPGMANKTEISRSFSNPFNTQTTIEVLLVKEGQVKITVFNKLGQKIII